MFNFRADKSEKTRKEVEHRCNFNEERLEKLQTDIITAKKTTRQAEPIIGITLIRNKFLVMRTLIAFLFYLSDKIINYV